MLCGLSAVEENLGQCYGLRQLDVSVELIADFRRFDVSGADCEISKAFAGCDDALLADILRIPRSVPQAASFVSQCVDVERISIESRLTAWLLKLKSIRYTPGIEAVEQN